MVEISEVSPCPFCGCKEATAAFTGDAPDMEIRAKCMGCEAYGPPIPMRAGDKFFGNLTKAIERFNTRAK